MIIPFNYGKKEGNKIQKKEINILNFETKTIGQIF
jgi:hypothetical protein